MQRHAQAGGQGYKPALGGAVGFPAAFVLLVTGGGDVDDASIARSPAKTDEFPAAEERAAQVGPQDVIEFLGFQQGEGLPETADGPVVDGDARSAERLGDGMKNRGDGGFIAQITGKTVDGRVGTAHGLDVQSCDHIPLAGKSCAQVTSYTGGSAGDDGNGHSPSKKNFAAKMRLFSIAEAPAARKPGAGEKNKKAPGPPRTGGRAANEDA